MLCTRTKRTCVQMCRYVRFNCLCGSPGDAQDGTLSWQLCVLRVLGPRGLLESWCSLKMDLF